MVDNPDLRLFIPDINVDLGTPERAQNEAKYIEGVRTTSWGGQLELQAIVRCYERPVILWELKGITLTRMPLDDSGMMTGCPINLLHYGAHYDLLVPAATTVRRCA